MFSLTESNIRFFNTFGFLHLHGMFADDIGWLSDEFAAVFVDRGLRDSHDSTEVPVQVPFIDTRARLCSLLDDPRLNGLIASLVGDDFNYLLSDGGYYRGDTAWHPDGMHTCGEFIKVGFYLDPLTRDTGALRVIPGSHLQERDWINRISGVGINTMEDFGVEQSDIPAVALETLPGDVLAFNQNLLHASFGGGPRRRAVMISCSRRAQTPEEIAELRDYLRGHNSPWGARAHGKIMRDTASPQRMVHLSQVMDNEDVLPELYAKHRLSRLVKRP